MNRQTSPAQGRLTRPMSSMPARPGGRPHRLPRPARGEGLYDPAFEHDACGVGLVANIDGARTHRIVQQAIEVLVNLGHRGARGADPDTGDGAGVLIQVPHDFLSAAAADSGIRLPGAGEYGVGMVFLPRDAGLRERCEKTVERAVQAEGMAWLGWRDVPTLPDAIGWLARQVMPAISQCFAAAPPGLRGDDLERKLYVTRKRIEAEIAELAAATPAEGMEQFYVCSMSARTIVYKGLIVADQISDFYPDLRDSRIVTAFAIVHSRFSTNTLGEWKLAHPYRMLCHNGEINTLQGNKNWMRAREPTFASQLFGDDVEKLPPITLQDESDTASFDKSFELLTMAGREIEHVAAMMIPEPWFGHETMSEEKKAFYEYHGALMEPWDGPAMIAFTDGKKVGAVLDRNGLRPMRYLVTDGGLLVMASETGVLDIEPSEVKLKSRLRPGMMFLVDFDQGRIIGDAELKSRLAQRRPYGDWLRDNQVHIDDLPTPAVVPGTDYETLVTRQQAFGYCQQDLRLLMAPMAESGAEPVGSMGNDSPLAVLSERPQSLFSYFRQQFAQVSNPPLDAIREQLVTQVSMTLGAHDNLFDETPEHCRLLRIDHPILSNQELARIRELNRPGLRTRTISTLWEVAQGESGLRAAMDRIRAEATDAARDGYTILILSDRGVDREHAPVPSLMAVGGVHHHMIREGTRMRVGLVVESGEPREVHHFAVLFGYGAGAINPYLALESVSSMSGSTAENGATIQTAEKAQANFIKAAEKGVLKVVSKMGISTLQSYHGAQIFGALGLSRAFVDEYFTWTHTMIEGIGPAEVGLDVAANHRRAFPERAVPAVPALDIGGQYLWRATGEHHMFNPETIALLQHAVNGGGREVFERFTKLADDESETLCTIRGLLRIKFDRAREIPVEEVEPATEIVKRFATGAISLGSISPEAHETLAVAMNRLGARSNTGEGGEDSARYTPEPSGDSRSSAIKQVASGRFGVTINYLTNARDLQIKMAQGSKPGEGGQINGYKITEYMGRIRHTTPGVDLVSPPPHHDIYSIEDLAQLIHDLKNANPDARVHVKLVSKAGVGTIAAGVSKGKGDVVLISGDSGGTGNSPLSSIKHAGLPWELGLAETQQTLVANGLRSRIAVQTDGQIKTGRDIAIAMLLGADEVGIATGSLVALGCIMLRKCHLNTCSVGIATQDPELRKKFTGTPEALASYFLMLAEQVRCYMARLGFRTVSEMIGRTDMLEPRRPVNHWKARDLDLSALLFQPQIDPDIDIHCTEKQDHGLERALDHDLISVAQPAIERGEPVAARFMLHNRHRTVGAMMSGRIARKYGDDGLPDGTINFTFEGSAGQSFGAFLAPGVTFRVQGDANDYFGKGLSGGRLILLPPKTARFKAEENIITGNVNLYGATGGEAFIRGIAGERFCVRNSGAHAVVEGVGDHACEYMTGGIVVVIGATGRNVAAGMSGGIAYILDEQLDFPVRCNRDLVDIESVPPGSENEAQLRSLIERHRMHTGSAVAERLLAGWREALGKFVMIVPRDYRRAIEDRARRARTGEPELVRHG